MALPNSSKPESHSYLASVIPRFSFDVVVTLAFNGTAGGPQTVIKKIEKCDLIII